jgi:hypothetical protein
MTASVTSYVNTSMGWHCACGDGRFEIPVWNIAGSEHCWNCGRSVYMLMGPCPLACGCRVLQLVVSRENRHD